jgi:hypothetical protein
LLHIQGELGDGVEGGPEGPASGHIFFPQDGMGDHGDVDLMGDLLVLAELPGRHVLDVKGAVGEAEVAPRGWQRQVLLDGDVGSLEAREFLLNMAALRGQHRVEICARTLDIFDLLIDRGNRRWLFQFFLRFFDNLPSRGLSVSN